MAALTAVNSSSRKKCTCHHSHKSQKYCFLSKRDRHELFKQPMKPWNQQNKWPLQTTAQVRKKTVWTKFENMICWLKMIYVQYHRDSYPSSETMAKPRRLRLPKGSSPGPEQSEGIFAPGPLVLRSGSLEVSYQWFLDLLGHTLWRRPKKPWGSVGSPVLLCTQGRVAEGDGQLVIGPNHRIEGMNLWVGFFQQWEV